MTIVLWPESATDPAVSASLESSRALANTQHGVSVYDDTSGAFDIDLGGGTFESAGLNVITGNGLEDLSLDYDGRALSARACVHRAGRARAR